MLRYILLTALFVSAAGTTAARAEEMNDDAIRALFKQSDEVTLDRAKAIEFVQLHIDDEFMLSIDSTLRLDGKSLKTRKVYDKRQFITDLETSTTKIEKAETQIFKISYSPDKRIAYVNESSHAALSLDIPTKEGDMAKAKGKQEQTCLDQIILVQATLKMVKSQCQQNLTIER